MSAKSDRLKALVLAMTALASLSQAVAQELGTEISFEKESTCSEAPVGPRDREPNNLDLVADRNESILQFANISDAFKPGFELARESDEDQHNSTKVGSTDSLELFDNHDDDDTWTEIGLYGFFVDISGEAKIGNVAVDADVSFSDILSNMDIGGMAFVQHRRGNWSFILDVAYLKISADDTVARNPFLSVELDAEFQQFLAEGFVGYRVFDRDYGDNRLGIDVLGGVRFNYITVDLGTEASLLCLTRSGSRDLSRSWTDGVIGLRAQFGQDYGWAVTGWADIGAGLDSSSYQLMGMLNYKFDNNIKVFAGYRHYGFEYERGSGRSRRGIDLDYGGPMIGVSYSF